MSKLLGLSLLIAAPSLHASEALKNSGYYIGNSLCRVGLIPFHIAALPFAVAGEILFPDKPQPKQLPAPQTTTTTVPKIEEPITPPSCTQSIGFEPQVTISDTSQHTETIDIPKVLESVVSHLPERKEQPVYINLNLNNQQAAATARTSKSLSPTQPPLPPKPSWLTVAKEYLTHKTKHVASWIYTHKFTVAALGVLGYYSWVHIYLWKIASHLSKSDCWSKWKQPWSLQELYQTPQNELIKSILAELQRLYKNKNHMINAGRFIKEADQELNMLTNFQRLIKRLDWLRLSWLTFVDRSTLVGIPERVKRLEFLKNTVAGWLKEHVRTHSYNSLFTQPTA